MIKALDFIKKNKNLINSALPFILIFYFIGVFLPNISGAVGFDALNYGYVKIIWRVSFALIFGLYIFFAFFANSLSLKRPLLLLVSIVFVLLLLSPLLNINLLTTQQSLVNGNIQTINTYKTGIIDIFAYIGNEVFFTFFLLVGLFIVFPVILKEKKRISVFLYFFIILMLILAILSFVIDKKFYLNIFRFDFSLIYSEKGISSLFPSKNTFGLFLFGALCTSFFVLKEDKRKKISKIFLIFSIFIFSLIILFTFCKSSIFSMLIFYFSLMLSKFKNNKKFFIIFLSLLFLLLVFGIVIICVPSLHDKNVFSYFYNLVTGATGSMVGRLSLVSIFLNNFGSSHLIFGYGPYLSNTVSSWVSVLTTNFSLDNLHNSYLMIFANGGVFYLILYVFLISYSFNISKHIKRIQIKNVLISMLFSMLFYSLFESNILFLSGSSGTFIFSLVLSSYALSISSINEIKERHLYNIDI